MLSETIYDIFNNASVAAIVAVSFTLFFARSLYQKQKNIDRDFAIKRDLINDIVSLQTKVHYTLLIIDRIAYSWSITKRDTEKFLEESLKDEIPKLSDAINEDVPSLHVKIFLKTNLYFNNTVIKEALKDFDGELKKWHDPIIKMQIDLKQRVDKQEILSSNELDKKIKNLIKVIWEEKII